MTWRSGGPGPTQKSAYTPSLGGNRGKSAGFQPRSPGKTRRITILFQFSVPLLLTGLIIVGIEVTLARCGALTRAPGTGRSSSGLVTSARRDVALADELDVGPLIVGPFIREAGSVLGLQEDELLGEHVEQAPIGDADLRDHRQGQK